MTTEEFELMQSEMSDDNLIKLTLDEVSNLARTGGRSHKMSIPPKITDTDMLFCELIKRFKKLTNLY
jgi:hypothetical protein